MTNDSPDHPVYASPPCFAHELDAGENGYAVAMNQTDEDVTRWRKAKREELIAARLAVPVAERKRIGDEVATELDRLIDFSPETIVSLYWPFRGELDLRDWMRQAHERGARIALPIVEAKAQPLIFREWMPGCEMARGVWNIPIPSGTDLVTPNVVISPLVGYDPGCYRLGYGGGFFDRTLAALPSKAKLIGVGHPCASIPTIHTQPHDIPMDVILTGKDRIAERNP